MPLHKWREVHSFQTPTSQSCQLPGQPRGTLGLFCPFRVLCVTQQQVTTSCCLSLSSCPVRCARDQEGYFADRLYKSMKGAGTNEETLIHIFVTRAEVSKTRWTPRRHNATCLSPTMDVISQQLLLSVYLQKK